jgi:uncharacterized membrane protein
MSIMQSVGMAILFMILGICFMLLIGVALYSLYGLWYEFNSDMIKRHRQARKHRRSWNED